MDIGCDCSFDFDNTNSIDMDKNMLPIGTLLNGGRYKVVKHLSSGGFGKTYVVEKVFHRGELYAMKEFFIKGVNSRRGNTVIVSNDENEDTFESQKSKFLTEAERLRDIENEHIVRVHDFFSDNETCYYIMDLIDGESLDAVKKPLKEEKVWDILNQVLDALSTIHQKKTIDNKKERIWLHLDIKPANLMIDKGGKVTLIDFGASKQLSANNNDLSLSMSQMSFTRGYAPIEQTSQNFDSIGPWTDFYALGATLYKLLTEKDSVIPEYSELAEILYSNDDIIKAFKFPKNISEKMRNLITWLMNPNRKKRPQSVEEIRGYLKDDIGDDSEKALVESEVTVIVNEKCKRPKSKMKLPTVKSLNTKKLSWIIRKKKFIGTISLLLLLITVALILNYVYLPYYNQKQLEISAVNKIKKDFERVDSIARHREVLADAVRGNLDNKQLVYIGKVKDRVRYRSCEIKDMVFRSKFGVFHYYGSYGKDSIRAFSASDSVGVSVFEDEKFYDRYNPYEWIWEWDEYENYYRGYKIEYKMGHMDSVEVNSFLHYHPEFKHLKGNRYFYGGKCVEYKMREGWGWQEDVFFCKNGDVIIGHFGDYGFEFNGNEYLVKHGDYYNYYFKGTFNCLLPLKGQWYDSEGRKTLVPQEEILGY